jgi:hypothetical protein
MRATGFGIGSPADSSGEFLYPMRTSDGKILNYNHKTITEARREKLFIMK